MDQDQTNETVPCANGCGFFGRACTANMCSRCYKESLMRLAEQKASAATSAVVPSAAEVMLPTVATSTPSASSSTFTEGASAGPVKAQIAFRERPRSPIESQSKKRVKLESAGMMAVALPPVSPVAERILKPSSASVSPASSAAAPPATSSSTSTVDRSRCAECKKKVGLTGIECRCGKVYCGSHRMAEKHACTFDFKTFGRQNIEKQNERVVARSLVDKL